MTSPSPFVLRNLKAIKEEVDRDNREKNEKLKTAIHEISDTESPFEELELISSKGIKMVYRVLDKRSNREVVFATLSEQKNKEQYQFSLINDAWVSSQLEHPNIPPIYEVGIKDEKPYFLMKFLKGQTLDEKLKNTSTPKFREEPKYWLRIFLDVCDALAFAHSKGILHLDIKAENIYVNSYHETLLFDWGCALNIKADTQDERLAKVCDLLESSRHSGVSWGTPQYMSPEQAKGQAESFDARTDTFLMGALLYQMMSGQVLYPQEELEDQFEHAEEGRFKNLNEVAASTPQRLQRVVHKALNIDPAKRYQSVSDLSNDIQAYLDDQLMSVDLASPWLSTRLFLRKHQRFTLVTLLVLFSISVISLFYSYQLKQSEMQIRQVKDQLEVSFLKQETLLNDLRGITSLSETNYLTVIFQENNLEKLNTLLEFQKENAFFWFEKGRALCGVFRFEEALECFEKSRDCAIKSKEDFRMKKALELMDYVKLLLPIKQEKLRDKNYLKEILVTIDDIKTRCMIIKTIYTQVFRDTDAQIEFCLQLIDAFHMNELTKIEFIKTSEGISVVSNNNTYLRHTSPLYFFPCHSIEIKGSATNKLYTLYNPELKRLNLSHTRVTNISTLPMFNLEYLNLDGCYITYFHLNQLSSLKECSLIDTEFLDYNINFLFKLIPNLTRLHVNEDLKLREDFLSESQFLEEVTFPAMISNSKLNRLQSSEKLKHIKFTKRPL